MQGIKVITSGLVEHKKTEVEANCALFPFFVLGCSCTSRQEVGGQSYLTSAPQCNKNAPYQCYVNKNVPCDAACCFGGTHLGQEKITDTDRLFREVPTSAT